MLHYSNFWAFWFFILRGISVLSSLYFILNNTSFLISWPFYNPNTLLISFDLLFDPEGLLFSGTVIFISASVLLFSSFYIAQDPFIHRFTLLVILFVLSINLLIFIPSLIAILLGWDGLGIISFCLVIYYQNAKSLAGGILTALSNRVGDAIILIAIALIMNNSSWLFINLTNSIYGKSLIILILIAAITKRAQLPFSSWLPAAIAAPTPVSALVHSSTLVTAGVFLLIRFYPFLSLFPEFHSTLLVISVTTLTIAGISAIVECDLKKIIALSTLRQLGVMIISLSLGLLNLAFFHLLTHAIFKALLFISAGSLLHLFSHNQDLRTFGNLCFQLPFIVRTIVISNLALSGFPFLAGFYSKDLILEFILESSTSFLLLFMALGATFLTSAYSIRLRIVAIWNASETPPCHRRHETSLSIIRPLSFLSFFAITGGAIFNWFYMPSPARPNIPPLIKIIPLFVTFWGASLTWSFGTLIASTKSVLIIKPLIINSLAYIWFFTPLRTQAPLRLSISYVQNITHLLDQGWLELIGPQGIPKIHAATLNILQPWAKNAVPLTFFLGLFILTPVLIHLSL